MGNVGGHFYSLPSIVVAGAKDMLHSVESRFSAKDTENFPERLQQNVLPKNI